MTEISMDDEQIKKMGRVYNLFHQTEEGRKFIDEMKKVMFNSPIFPMPLQTPTVSRNAPPVFPDNQLLKSFGNSVEAYAGFRSGQLNFIKYIEDCILFYQGVLSKTENKENTYAE